MEGCWGNSVQPVKTKRAERRGSATTGNPWSVRNRRAWADERNLRIARSCCCAGSCDTSTRLFAWMWFTFHESFFNLAEAQAESAVEPHRMTDTCRGIVAGSLVFHAAQPANPTVKLTIPSGLKGMVNRWSRSRGKTNHSAEGKRLVSEGEASGFLKSHS